MSSAEVQGVFNIEEEPSYSYELKEQGTAESPSNFLNNLQPEQTTQHTQATAHTQSPIQHTQSPIQHTQLPQETQTSFMPAAISPSLMLSSMANSSPAAENILSSAKERLNQIRPWKDFFSIDQFRIPESSTAAQSRASHNFSHFQNNYLIILLLFSAFSL